jgi:glutathione S-transferase
LYYRRVQTVRLVTIPFSHYCEKARWALDRAQLDYVEEPHPPIIHWLSTFKRRARRTTPVLLTAESVLTDSTDILHFCDAHGRAQSPLFPPGNSGVAALEDRLDEKLGPATRRLAYHYILADRELTRSLLARGVGRWESRLAARATPLIAAMIRRGFKINDAGFERSLSVIERELAHVEELLADGRRYLAGDVFTAADLTFAALAVPLVIPQAYTRFIGDTSRLPAAFWDRVATYRVRAAGRFALRLYDEERAPPLQNVA